MTLVNLASLSQSQVKSWSESRSALIPGEETILESRRLWDLLIVAVSYSGAVPRAPYTLEPALLERNVPELLRKVPP